MDIIAEDGALYPLRVVYGGRSVLLEYEPRTDVVTKYIGGLPARLSRRVRKIASYLENAPVMEYRFAYEKGELTGRSRLVSVTQGGSKGGTLTPTRFVWQEGDANVFGEAATLPATGTTLSGTLLPM